MSGGEERVMVGGRGVVGGAEGVVGEEGVGVGVAVVSGPHEIGDGGSPE